MWKGLLSWVGGELLSGVKGGPSSWRGRRDGMAGAGVRGGRRAGEGGAATIWVVALIGMVWTFGVTVMVAGGVRAARHRAHAAADDGALAAASHAAEGVDAACAAALRIVRASDAVMTS